MTRDSSFEVGVRQRFPHQMELEVFQIAQPAMEQLGRGAGGGLCQIAHFGQNNGQATPCGIAGNPASVDAPTDHKQIDRAAMIRVMWQIRPPRGCTISGDSRRCQSLFSFVFAFGRIAHGSVISPALFAAMPHSLLRGSMLDRAGAARLDRQNRRDIALGAELSPDRNS
jgi:hypothetical protein